MPLTQSSAVRPPRERQSLEVPNLLRQILSHTGEDRAVVERRERRRYPYPALITLRPLETSDFVEAAPIVVVGKEISATGIGFFHEGPLPQKRVVATFNTPSGRLWNVVVELLWCRFVQNNWYDSGGRFLFRHPVDDLETRILDEFPQSNLPDDEKYCR